MKITLAHKFEGIVNVENLLEAWREFIKGKRGKKDVQEFQLNLMDNILQLHRDLSNHTYKHGGYQAFKINDPKPRQIHKATVRDRLLHHAIYRILYPFFDRTFIGDSFSCRNKKGTHKAINHFRSFFRKASQNDTQTCWVLKCDIRKFFASIDQNILIRILKTYILDQDIIRLLEEVIGSFYSSRPGIGLPLGNLTSQLFANIYMNEFDQFVKHKLKAEYYIRYADDFIILSRDRKWLRGLVMSIGEFLRAVLELNLHPDKISIKTLNSGVDFLGWVNFPGRRVLRTTTKKRMLKRIMASPKSDTLASYLSLLGHGNAKKLKRVVEESFLHQNA